MELPKQINDDLKPIPLIKINSFDIIFKQHGLSMSIFNPNGKSPNQFVNKLEHRMKNYYESLKQEN